MNFIPFIRRELELSIPQDKVLSELRKLTLKDFDLFRTEDNSKSKKLYESEIYTNSFKIRRIRSSGYQSSPLVGTTIYCRFTTRNGKLFLRHTILFNIYTSFIFSGCLLALSVYTVFSIYKNHVFDYIFLLFGLGFYIIFVICYNVLAPEDKDFMDTFDNALSQHPVNVRIESL